MSRFRSYFLPLLAAACVGGVAAPPIPSSSVTSEAETFVRVFPALHDTRLSAYHPVFAPDGSIDFWEAELTRGGRQQGYIMLSATRNNSPIVELSGVGESHHARFANKVQAPFRMMRFGSSYIAALSESNELLDEIGDRPRSTVPELMAAYQNFAPGEQARSKIAAAWAKVDARNAARPTLATASLAPSDGGTPIIAPDGGANLGVGGFPEGDPWYTTTYVAGFDMLTAETDCSVRQNLPYFVQITANTPPNTTGGWSGCVNTAWMNLFGWFDMHGYPGVFPGAHQTLSDSWSTSSTMYFYNHDNTWNNLGEGSTNANDTHRGIDFIDDVDNDFPSSPIYERGATTGEWGLLWGDYFEDVRSAVVDHHVPAVVGENGNGEGYHVASALGVAVTDQNFDNFVWINTSYWNNISNQCQSKWIDESSLTGAWSLLGMKVVKNGGFEDTYGYEPRASSDMTPGYVLPLTSDWYATGTGSASFSFDGTGPHSGAHSGRILVDGNGPDGSQQLAHKVTVEPYRHYRATMWSKAQGFWSPVGVLVGIRSVGAGAGGFDKYENAGTATSWTQWTFDFVGPESGKVEMYGAIDVILNSPQGGWLRLDDFSISLLDAVEDGDFELQNDPNGKVKYPWERRVDSLVQSGIISGGQDGGNVILLGNAPCPSTCTASSLPSTATPGQGHWSDHSQLISVVPGRSYTVTARVLSSYTAVTVGVTDMLRTYAATQAGAPAHVTHPELANKYWQDLSFTFTATSNTQRIYFGYDPPPSGANLYIDKVNVQVTPPVR